MSKYLENIGYGLIIAMMTTWLILFASFAYGFTCEQRRFLDKDFNYCDCILERADDIARLEDNVLIYIDPCYQIAPRALSAYYFYIPHDCICRTQWCEGQFKLWAPAVITYVTCWTVLIENPEILKWLIYWYLEDLIPEQ